MATAHPSPAASGHPQIAPAAGQAAGATLPPRTVSEQAATETAQALVPAPPSQQEDEEAVFPRPILRLPVDLTVSVPVRDFRMRRLLALAPGQVIESQWNSGDDLPLASGDVQVAWSEFEVVETQLAVRITRLE